MTSQTSASSLRIAHCGDLHIGAGYVHGDEDRGGVNSRLRDFQAAWVRSAEAMAEEQIDLVLIAGDIFDNCKPTPTEQAAFREGLDVLAEARIPVVMITGDHDEPRQIGRTHALRIFDEYPNVSVMDRPGVVFGGDVLIPVACLPVVRRAHLAAKDPDFEKLTLDEQNTRIVDLMLQTLRSLGAEAESMAGPFGCVLVGHAAIAGSAVGAAGSTAFFRDPVLPLPELRGLPFVAQCWGHLHRRQILADWPTFIGYSGSIERTDFAEAEEAKGWFLLTLNEDAALNSCEWYSSGPRAFVDFEIHTEGGLQTWPTKGLFVEGAVVRVRYTATPEQARTVDHAAIRRELYGLGAVKVHGPMATILHNVTEASDAVTEDTDMLTGWNEWATLQGLSGAQRERLDRKVGEALEVLGG